MIVDKIKKYIFVAVPKTGTATLQNYILKVATPEILKQSFIKEDYHLNIAKIAKKYLSNDDHLNNYYKFAFHRNPWDRMVSFFYDYSTSKSHIESWSAPLLKYKNFEEFVLDFPNSNFCNHINFMPTTYYTHINGKQIVDEIGMYSNYKSDSIKFLKVCKINTTTIKNNLTYKFKLLNHYNKSQRESDYKIYYNNPKMISIVGDLFHQDIITFQDKFDE